ncbi:MAG: hypothetical protein A2854_02935 [Parcubacteria group bacterium RIFCSPHIGHO2_01_FULL_56_18]|nr:MAG: hypothetical protein A2854_02935 [Parcubacteria group bacterium RIFCSPHIGHO2_01_FULL_56_18]
MSIIRDREPTAQRTDRILNEILAESPRESPFDDPSYPIGFEKIITMEGAQQFLLRQLRRFLYFLRGLQTDSTEIESLISALVDVWFHRILLRTRTPTSRGRWSLTRICPSWLFIH